MDTIIKEIFETYQVRKSKKQKTAFIDYTQKKAEELGWNSHVEKGAFGARNIVVGDPDKAKVVYTAHYDTCSRLPFPNFLTPKHFGIYLLYNVAVVLGFFMAAFAIGFLIGVVAALANISSEIAALAAQVIYLFLVFLILVGPANKHTANDNTSGITVLFGIMKNLPADQREKVALVFFDLEEMGLIGSASFASKHKQIKAHTLLLNFDCVSDGEDMMILTKKKAKPYTDLLKEAYTETNAVHPQIIDKAFYPSDQVNFKAAVGVASFKKTKGGMLYMNRIHTSKDTVYRKENIDFLVNGSIKLTEKL